MKVRRFPIYTLPLIALFCWTLSACDIIDAPYVETVAMIPSDSLCQLQAVAADPFGPGSPTVVRKLLLEEMTGHQCGNCPEATALAHELRNQTYPGRIVTISIHSGPLAATKSSGSKYNTDFTTTEGDQIYSEFNVFDAIPFGLFNRNTIGLGGSQWTNLTDEQLQLAPEAGIRIFNCYDPSNRELTTVVDVKYLQDASENEFLAVYLVEDNIVDWQTDYNLADNDIPDYTHHDVFRGSINGIWGESLSPNPVSTDDRFTKAYTIQIDEAFDVQNCKVVAFVHNFDTKHVRQVEEAPLVQ